MFAVFVIVLGELTNRVSQVKVRFSSIADQIGGAVLAVMIGWVMVSFTLTTLHTAPLSRNFLFGGFRAESRMFMGFTPDRNWLGFVKMVSRGSFCQSPVAEFDPENDFMPKYTSRRESVSELVQSRDTIFGEPDSPQRGGDRGR